MPTYTLSCHCGAVRAEASADLSKNTFRCNCTFCAKTRNWSADVEPGTFKLLCDEADVGDYGKEWPGGNAHHRFCRACGTHVYGHGHIPQVGGDYVVLRVSAIDNITPEELAALPVTYQNGRDDDWMNPPKVTSYL
jgi:hypothetical protein